MTHTLIERLLEAADGDRFMMTGAQLAALLREAAEALQDPSHVLAVGEKCVGHYDRKYNWTCRCGAKSRSECKTAATNDARAKHGGGA